MTRIFIGLAAIAATTAPLMAVEHMATAPTVVATSTSVIIGLDRPILLKRMVVTATALPDHAR